MSQNLRTVSDIANSTTHQQQCSRLGTTDSLLKKIGEVHRVYTPLYRGKLQEVIKLG